MSWIRECIADVKDNPARVAPPDYKEVRQSKPRRKVSDLDRAQQRIVIDEWVSQQDDPGGWIMDQLSIIDTRKLMTHFVASDDAEIGRMVASLLLGLGHNVDDDEGFGV